MGHTNKDRPTGVGQRSTARTYSQSILASRKQEVEDAVKAFVTAEIIFLQ